MTRKTLFLDRVSTLILALLLIAAGALGLIWWDGRVLDLPAASNTADVEDVTTSSWWPWASGFVGVLLVLIGLRWILAHLRSQQVKTLRLSGSGEKGRFEVDGAHVVNAAAEALSDTSGVRSARGRIEHDRGLLVAHLTATIEPESDLRLIAERSDTVSAQLRQVVQRQDLRCSVELKVASRGRTLTRVS